MTLPILNSGDGADSFFTASHKNPPTENLISAQIDPTQPQINGLSRVSDPIISPSNSIEMVSNFDPELYDLRPTSHLMRLIRALAGSVGVGGLRKQNIQSRIVSSIMGASFVDLDGFYGALFNLRRLSRELMPTNVDGTTLNPFTDVANSDIWDSAISSDSQYRSRIQQLARAINMGGSYTGMKAVAEAIVNIDVDLVESWVKVDAADTNSQLSLPTQFTYGQISAQKVTWGNISSSYNTLSGSTFGAGATPTGNRGELVFTPRRVLSAEETYQLNQVLQVLKPSHTQVTISPLKNVSISKINPRNYSSDSEHWIVQTRITPSPNIIQPTIPLYQNAGQYSSARPAFSEYVGESWSYNPNVIKTSSYQLDTDGSVLNTEDQETIIYNDGESHVYRSQDGIMDAHKAISDRLSGDGVVTVFPYTGNRTQYQLG